MSETGALLLAGALLTVGLAAPLTTPDEVRYSEIPAEMLTGGDWVVPQLHGEAYLDKPPLHYWLVAAGYRAVGQGPAVARWPSTASAVLSLVVLFVLGSALFGRGIALSATALLAVTPAFQFASHYASLDALFLLWTTVTQLALWLGLRDRDRTRARWVLIAALSCGLAILTKGPVALVIAVPPVLAWDWLRRRRLRAGAWSAFFALAGLVSLPWFVAVNLRHPEFLDHFIVQHHFHRFTGLLEHQRPWWFFIPVLLLSAFPLSLLLPSTLASIVKLDPDIRRQRADQLGVVVLAALWPIVFFSLSSGKLPSYILPAFPFLAILLGWHCHLEPPPRARLSSLGVLAVSAAASLALAYAAQLGLLALAMWALLWAAAATWCLRATPARVAAVIVAALLLNAQLLTTVLPNLAESRSLLGRASWHADNLPGSAPTPIALGPGSLPVSWAGTHSEPVLQLDPDDHRSLERLLEVRQPLVVVAEPQLIERYRREPGLEVETLERGGHVYALRRLDQAQSDRSPPEP